MRGIDALINPVLIVEVLSPTTESGDREEKFRAYQAIASFSEYLLIAQDTPNVTQYVRQADGRWTREDFNDFDAVLTLGSIACTLTLRQVYEEVEFGV